MSETQQSERLIVAFFSASACDLNGYAVATTGDGKTVQYTAIMSQGSAEEYKWPDKSIVYQGPESGFKFVKNFNNQRYLRFRTF